MGNRTRTTVSKARSNRQDRVTPPLPDRVSVAVAELAGQVKEGLLAVAVATGLQVLEP